MRKLFMVVAFFFTMNAQFAWAEPIDYVITTKDGLTKISGEIDKPNCGLAKYPAVLIVGGTGLFSRNGFFGRSKTDRDLLFKDLSERLGQKCIATVRFDYRGVSCDLKAKANIETCVDQNVRSHVTDETILDDIQSVYEFARSQVYLDNKRLAVLGHSEGSLNISRLVASKRINPSGIMYFGGITESAKSILHYQIAERPVEWAFTMDANSDGVLTNEQLKAGFESSELNGNFPLDQILSPTGFWSKTDLSAEFEGLYKAVSSEALSKADSDPYAQSGVVFAGYKWWKRWFTDDVTVLENLKDFSGPIEYHNGTIDTQAPGIRESEFLKSSAIKMRSKPNFVLHKQKGHGLGSDPLYGPIDEPIADQIVETISSWMN